jgi:regulator of protease activity HflC (stomatin/prohibitin superfamily)
MYIPFDWLIIIGFLVALSLRIVRRDERLVVLRLGRFLRVEEPGLVWLIPVVQKGIKVKLNRDFPGWEVLPEMELQEKIKASFLKDFPS